MPSTPLFDRQQFVSIAAIVEIDAGEASAGAAVVFDLDGVGAVEA